MRLTNLFFLLIILLTFGCKSEPKIQTDSGVLSALNFEWELIKNYKDDKGNFRQQAVFTVENNGTKPIEGNWTLYFNQVSGPVTGKTESGNGQLTHINGGYFSLQPTASFTNLLPKEKVTFTYQGANWAIKNSDAPAGLYATLTNEKGKEGEPISIKNYKIVPFTKKEQLARMETDKFPVPTNEYRYEQNSNLTKLAKKDLIPIIPTPRKLTRGQGVLTLDETFTICYLGEFKSEANYLSDKLEALGLTLKDYDGGACNGQTIRIATIAKPILGKKKEAYNLTIDPDQEVVNIEGTDADGIFNGIQSLLALIPNEAYKQENDFLELPALSIKDAPRFEYRGLMLDVARNFQSKKTVKKLLDLMAVYKLNKFHFHLTDDEGWRVEIDGLPELTTIGSKRGHTLDESDRLQPAYGSGGTVNNVNTSGTGFFTKADYIEILKYAQERHIEVIPEIDLPGHARAAIVSMKARYKRLMAEGKEAEAKQYLLHDADDKSEYSSAQVYNDNVICVCQESTYEFIAKVVDGVVALHKEAGVPLKVIHTGGDEVPVGVWTKSPICDEFLKNTPSVKATKVGLTNHFMRNFAKILDERGLVTGGWEEIGLKMEDEAGNHIRTPNMEFADRNFQPYVWNSIFGWGGEDIAYQLANSGYKVILCNASNLYFDLAYDKDPENSGLYWAGFVNTRNTYEFVPFNLFKTASMGRFGEQLDPDSLEVGQVAINEAAKKNVLGIQGQLWSETLINEDRLEYSTFPKLMGLAERAWAAQPAYEIEADKSKRFAELDRNWNQFSNTLGQKEMTRLDYISGGVGYYIPPAGAKIVDGKLYANTGYPGLNIRYTLDGSEPTMTSTEYTEPIAVDGDVRVKVFSGGGNSSRSSLIKKNLVD